jgi:hypothetical protein
VTCFAVEIIYLVLKTAIAHANGLSFGAKKKNRFYGDLRLPAMKPESVYDQF